LESGEHVSRMQKPRHGENSMTTAPTTEYAHNIVGYWALTISGFFGRHMEQLYFRITCLSYVEIACMKKLDSQKYKSF
jgi:hypothetical protein